MRYILFPGRHHVLTQFQARYLTDLRAGLCTDTNGVPIEGVDDSEVIFAVTSWDQAGTRRNPLPGHRREAAIELFGRDIALPVLVAPVPNVSPTPRFADVTINAVDVHTAGRVRLTPDNTIVACSSPEVSSLYADDGFRVASVELDGDTLHADRPWTLVEELATTRSLEKLTNRLHPASSEILSRYQLVDQISEIFSDPLLGEDGDLTETRDYITYGDSFDQGADRKFDLVRNLIRPGRIVDIGCGTGALLAKIAEAPELGECDLFGLEAARPLFEICEHRRTMGWFPNENTFFYHRNVLNSPVLADASIDTTITMALTHEVLSYGSHADVVAMAGRIFQHTRPGGVWLNADVCGPADPNIVVEFDLATDDGVVDSKPDTPTASLDDVGGHLSALSTWSRWLRFVEDFRAHEGETNEWEPVSTGTARAARRLLYEFLSKKDYPINWLSEMHERFCTYTYDDWTALVEDAGFVIAAGSMPYRNDWIVENRWRPTCSIRSLEGAPEDFGTTHIILAAAVPNR